MLLLRATLHSESVQTIKDVQPTINTVHLMRISYPVSAILSQAFAADDDCGSAAGASAREVGISGVLVLLDINANGLDITHLQVIDWIVWWIEDSDGRSKLPLDR